MSPVASKQAKKVTPTETSSFPKNIMTWPTPWVIEYSPAVLMAR